MPGAMIGADRMKNASVLVSLVLGALAFSACDDAEPFFHHCPLSTTIIDVCEQESTDTELTCVVREHPMCEEQVCASWKGSDSFCSRACAADSDCPVDSTCQAYLAYSVCVPNAVPPGPLVGTGN